MKYITSLLLATLIATVSLGQLRITGESKVSEHRLIRLQADGLPRKEDGKPDGVALIWDVSDEDRFDMQEFGRELIASAPPGTYKIKLRSITVQDGSAKVETARITVTVTKSGPGPGPGPDPKPDPDPVPDPTPIVKAWLVVIEETENAANNRAAYLTNAELVGYMKAKGWKHRIADKDAKNASGERPRDLVPYLDRAAKVGLPYVCLVDQNGSVRLEGKLPPSPATLLQQLKEIGK